MGLWVVLAMAALSFELPGTALAMLAGLGLGIAALDVVLGLREPAVEVDRSLPERAYVGGCFPVALRAHNRAARPLSLVVLEALPRGVETDSETVTIEVPAKGIESQIYEIRPKRRGDANFGRAIAFSASPLGLWRRRLAVAGDVQLRVYPDARRLLRGGALDPRRILEQLGAKVAPRRGEGLDFESLRDYLPGDDPRRLDWAASARRGRPVVRQYQHERNHNVVIALDSSRLMSAQIAGRTKLDYAVDTALVLAYAALVSGDRTALALFDREFRGYLAPRSRRGELGVLLDFLRPIQPRPVEPDFEAFVRGLAARQRQRSLIIVLTDFVEVEAMPLVHAFRVLARRHRVLLVALRDPLLREIDPRTSDPVGNEREILRRLVLADVAHQRERVLLSLNRAAVQTLDLSPAEVTAEALNRYLALRCGA